ncbi:MAG: hypothetical protein JOZ90_09045 [Alphaproteobacteria bacterium]|nr:hypothetical protein [Alphaproteobacteria bacterium]MBV9185973.1 hypothetical protein [Acidobacteriota bacterium]MBV9373263.1 hypothetical protein [Alphaproteobacteria bacterium]MBV9901229.1 hypothetical protein [Alphaproteobacteria bacterium]
MLQAAAPPPAQGVEADNPVTAQLASMFISACLDGRLDLRPDQGREVSRKALPASDQDDARGSKSARYFRIVKPAKAVLVMADYDPPARDGRVYLCMIDTPRLDVKAAGRLIDSALKGLHPARSFGESSYDAFVPQERVSIYVSRTQMALTRLDQAAADRIIAKFAKIRAAPTR